MDSDEKEYFVRIPAGSYVVRVSETDDAFEIAFLTRNNIIIWRTNDTTII